MQATSTAGYDCVTRTPPQWRGSMKAMPMSRKPILRYTGKLSFFYFPEVIFLFRFSYGEVREEEAVVAIFVGGNHSLFYDKICMKNKGTF